MSSVIPKPTQKTDFVVRAGAKAVYRGNSAGEARSVARAHGENATVTFRTSEAADAYLHRNR